MEMSGHDDLDQLSLLLENEVWSNSESYAYIPTVSRGLCHEENQQYMFDSSQNAVSRSSGVGYAFEHDAPLASTGSDFGYDIFTDDARHKSWSALVSKSQNRLQTATLGLPMAPEPLCIDPREIQCGDTNSLMPGLTDQISENAEGISTDYFYQDITLMEQQVAPIMQPRLTAYAPAMHTPATCRKTRKRKPPHVLMKNQRKKNKPEQCPCCGHRSSYLRGVMRHLVACHRPVAALMGLDVSKVKCRWCEYECDSIRKDRLIKHEKQHIRI